MDNRISDELVERMVALVRAMVDAEPFGWAWVHATEARAIAALLPKPVDPDLLEARAVAIDRLRALGASSEQIAAGGIEAGEGDDFIVMHIALACIKRGRELASPNLGAGSLGGER